MVQPGFIRINGYESRDSEIYVDLRKFPLILRCGYTISFNRTPSIGIECQLEDVETAKQVMDDLGDILMEAWK